LHLSDIVAVSFGMYAQAGTSHYSDLLHRAGLEARNTSDDFLDAVAYPNATGSWPFRGIDVTKPMVDVPSDEVGQGNGWSINIAVATNVSGSRSNPERRINPHYIYLQAPENAFENSESSLTSSHNWETCAIAWIGNRWSVEEIEKLHQDPDGSCNDVVSDDCVADMKLAVLENGCNLWSRQQPESCPGALSSVMVLTTSLELSPNKSTYGISEGWWSPTSNLSEEAVRDAYDEAVTTVYPVMLLYYYEDDEIHSSYSVFRCVLANNITEGSRQPETFGPVTPGPFGIGDSSAYRSQTSLLCLITAFILSLLMEFST
ncbi:hypothetical protein CT0861_10107, partial [Colletotrichum tofieldiae]